MFFRHQMRKMSVLLFIGTVPINVYTLKLFLLRRVVVLTAVCKTYRWRMGRIGLLPCIDTKNGQKETTAYLFKAIIIYYEDMAVLHSSHRLKSHVHLWWKIKHMCRNNKFLEDIFHSCISLLLSRTPKHILHIKDLNPKVLHFFLWNLGRNYLKKEMCTP